MFSLKPEFTSLEQAVLRAICEMHPRDQAALETQLSMATFLNRKNTGAGFFTYFKVEHDSNVVIGGERLRDGPNAKVDGLKHGMGFILFLKEGYVDFLEGYCNGNESTTEIALESVWFEIIHV